MVGAPENPVAVEQLRAFSDFNAVHARARSAQGGQVQVHVSQLDSTVLVLYNHQCETDYSEFID